MAAMQVPSILIPYPASADDHQYHNARAFAQPGAARMMVQSQLRAETIAESISELITDAFIAEQMRAELRKRHYPEAADQIAEALLRGSADPKETPRTVELPEMDREQPSDRRKRREESLIFAPAGKVRLASPTRLNVSESYPD
jgi:hypothetical protein